MHDILEFLYNIGTVLQPFREPSFLSALQVVPMVYVSMFLQGTQQ
jgi:hypothetical protein